eukprot:GEMP01000869.1.p1 GENE.GEMP01000869.1~~GEMP01000869.1.p1  ORF type:complete len:986 (+),score=207.66 GEMP01000869.1:218-3175(+)
MADAEFCAPQRIAAGFFHTLALSNETKFGAFASTVYAWGSNKHGMLGISAKQSLTPVEVPIFKGKYIFEVACGSNHSVVLEKKPDQDGGHVWAFGMPNNGRLGRQEMSNDPEIVAFPDSTTRIARIACGSDHTLVISEHGQVYAWGMGNYGNLGLGTSEDVYEPRLVTALDQRHTVQVACGSKHSLALTKEGFVYSWGYGGNGRLGLHSLEASLSPKLITSVLSEQPSGSWGLGTPMRVIAAGEAHSGCLTDLGNVYTWGAGAYGRAGHGEETDAPVPRQVEILGGIPCSKISLGMLHSVVLTTKGKLYSWGTGTATGLLSPHYSSVVPTPREVISQNIFVEVRCGTYHTVALSNQGELFTWGLGTDGRLGLGSTDTSYAVTSIRGVKGWKYSKEETAAHTSAIGVVSDESSQDDRILLKQISCGGSHSAALLKNGTLFCWGNNEYGQVGTDPKSIAGKDVFEPYLHRTISGKVTHVACGLEHTIAIAVGRLWVWGRGSKGQLGLGKSKEALEPQMLQGLIDVVDASAGEDHSCVVLASGELYTWGSAECGKLGHGSSMTTTCQYLPRQVRVNDRIESVFCGAEHSAVVNAQGRAFSFGAGWFGRLGQGSTMNAYVPSPIDLPDNLLIHKRDVFCGTFHTCLLINQELWVTGRDRQVCEPDHILSPMKFAPFEEDEIKVVTVAVAPQHTLCISTEGWLYAWGENKKGQLGVGRAQARVDEPERNRMLEHRVALVATGPAHTLVLLVDGTLQGMGTKNGGRLTLPVRGEKQKDTYAPTLLNQKWKQEEESGQLMEESEPSGDGPADGKESSKPPQTAQIRKSPFLEVMQSLVKEDERHLEEALNEEAAQLSREMKSSMDHLIKIGASLEYPESTGEGKIRAMEFELESSLCYNLQILGLHEQAPRIKKVRVPQEILAKMDLYEKLMFILQQHPCYLANLSTYCTPESKSAELFIRVVKRIFADLRNERILNLYKALVRQVMVFEVI